MDLSQKNDRLPSLKQRLLGMLLDYLVIVIYIGLLLLFAFVAGLIASPPHLVSPWMGELIGFAALTLPTGLYFILTESSSIQASLGMQFAGITITNQYGNKPKFRQILLRNSLKLLPWEIAHMSIWHIFVPDGAGGAFINAGLITSNVFLVVYLLTIIFRRDHGGLYDAIAGTSLRQIIIR